MTQLVASRAAEALGAQLMVIPGVGHSPNIEASAVFVELLTDLWRSAKQYRRCIAPPVRGAIHRLRKSNAPPVRVLWRQRQRRCIAPPVRGAIHRLRKEQCTAGPGVVAAAAEAVHRTACTRGNAPPA
ncbi:MAG: hypothetical protein RMJ55_18215 [Roseiflexaceae bacterium]|nr:hypothetical protein [Roseiflexaceae bacterium]